LQRELRLEGVGTGYSLGRAHVRSRKSTPLHIHAQVTDWATQEVQRTLSLPSAQYMAMQPSAIPSYIACVTLQLVRMRYYVLIRDFGGKYRNGRAVHGGYESRFCARSNANSLTRLLVSCYILSVYTESCVYSKAENRLDRKVMLWRLSR
jgi:hypothetical protein